MIRVLPAAVLGACCWLMIGAVGVTFPSTADVATARLLVPAGPRLYLNSPTAHIGFDVPAGWTSQLPGFTGAGTRVGIDLRDGQQTCRILIRVSAKARHAGALVRSSHQTAALRYGDRWRFHVVERARSGPGRWYRTGIGLPKRSGLLAMGYYEQRTPRFAGSTPYVPVTAVTLLAVTGQLVPSQNAETGEPTVGMKRTARCQSIARSEVRRGLEHILASVHIARSSS